LIKRIKNFFTEALNAPTGAFVLVFAIMLILSIFNFINTKFLLSSNAWLIPMVALAFILPCLVFWKSHGGKKYVPTLHLAVPQKYHIPTIVFSTCLILLGSMLIKIFLISGKYREFPLYNTFFATRNESIFNILYLVISFCVIPPIFEGLVFRGIILKEFNRRGFVCAVLCSSILSALLGFDFVEFIPRLFLGMLVFLEIYFIVFCNSGGTIQDITAMPWQNFGNAKRRVPPRCSHCGLR
jgi:membrane protease YdiL (CAAX protease family)